MQFIPTTQTQLDRLKDRAKSLRNQYDRLGHARDAAAKEMGYTDYHHAIHCASLTAAQSSVAAVGLGTGDLRQIDLAIDRLAELLAGDPAVDLSNPGVRAAMQRFQGLRTASLLAKAWFTERPRTFFRDALHDFDAFGGDEFPPTVANKSPAQRDQAHRLWTALLDDRRSAAFHLLYSYAYMKQFACYAAGLQKMRPGDPVYSVNERLLVVMQAVIESRDADEALDYIQGAADELMPREMNISIHTGAEDYERPSTWWSRIQAGVAIQMAGVCSILPFDLLAAHLVKGATGKLPFTPLYTPTAPAIRDSYLRLAKERWMALPQ